MLRIIEVSFDVACGGSGDDGQLETLPAPLALINPPNHDIASNLCSDRHA